MGNVNDWRLYNTSWTWKEYVAHISTPRSSLESLAEMKRLSRIDTMEEFPLHVDRAVDGILARMMK